MEAPIPRRYELTYSYLAAIAASIDCEAAIAAKCDHNKFVQPFKQPEFAPKLASTPPLPILFLLPLQPISALYLAKLASYVMKQYNSQVHDALKRRNRPQKAPNPVTGPKKICLRRRDDDQQRFGSILPGSSGAG